MESTLIDMQISETSSGPPIEGMELCRFPKLEECAHFHYERVHLPKLTITIQNNIDQSLHSQHTNDDDDTEWYMVQVTSGDECWLLQRNLKNFQMLDDQLHQCIYDRKIFQLPNLMNQSQNDDNIEEKLRDYLEKFSDIADNSVNCGSVLNWLQMDNKGHRLLVPSEESRSINTPAVAAAYSVRKYVSQARDELNLEVGDMISVIDMANPIESMWWRGKRGFQVGFFPQYCVHIIGDKVPRNMPLPPPVVGSLALTPIKPVLRKHGKLITFFRSFILNRPSRRRLKQSGILKERVFGCDLGEHLLNSGHDIPMVLKCCSEFIEKNGIVDGIYRLSGVTSNIQKLRNAFDEDRIPNLYTDEILQDIHSVASLLKMYFRELPNPLCTYQLYQSFVNAVQGCTSIRNAESDHERLLKMREAVQKLPPPHYRTLEYLMKHLAKVAKHGTNTGMTTRNVAIVWAPNLLRCAELEVGGVAALQGVGVQAVVTEFLICYAHLIFSDHLPNLEVNVNSIIDSERKKCNTTVIKSPVRKNRPKSLSISTTTPTKLITLEEARTKQLLLQKNDDCNDYIEVGGGPKNLPKKYHTVIELPLRKRNKRSPLGWRSLFQIKSKQQQHEQQQCETIEIKTIVNRKIQTTNNDNIDDNNKLKLRSVKSAESLISNNNMDLLLYNNNNELIDNLSPLNNNNFNKQQIINGHNRSVSHDSYFDLLLQQQQQQENDNNSDNNSLFDLSEIQFNFELEESEMRIFSEDESLVSSPKMIKDGARRILTRCHPDDYYHVNSMNPSPKKQARIIKSPPPLSLNESQQQLLQSRKRTRLEEQLNDIQYIDCNTPDNLIMTTALIHNLPVIEPKNKSLRNSIVEEENVVLQTTPTTPQSPNYCRLLDESVPTSPKYENILTTINIIYKSPDKKLSTSKNLDDNNRSTSEMENVFFGKNGPESVLIPTSTASLPYQEAHQPPPDLLVDLEKRPKSLSDLDNLKCRNLSLNVICDRTNEKFSSFNDTLLLCDDSEEKYSLSSMSSFINNKYNIINNEQEEEEEEEEEEDISLSIINNSSNDCFSTSQSLLSFDSNEMKNNNDFLLTSPNVSSLQNSINFCQNNDNNDNEDNNDDGNIIYEQVKEFRRSIYEVNALLNLDEENATKSNNEEENYDSLESNGHVYENVELKSTVEKEENCGEKEMNEEKLSVKDLTIKFEEKSEFLNNNNRKKVKKFYEKDSLPPCLRARNLKSQLKTRSLDEEEFKKEFPIKSNENNVKDNEDNDNVKQIRRKSMDETMKYKTNSLPKKLNPPKILLGNNEKLNKIHLTHSNENLQLSVINDEEQQKKRERIEKYKEERRKFLQDKYRSESFKEDKEKLLSKLKIFNSSTSGNSNCKKKNDVEVGETAIFQQFNNNNDQRFVELRKRNNFHVMDDSKCDLRRHTYETEERDEDNDERLKRISLENRNSRREKTSPCIKDMKAIFENKFKQ